MNMHDALRALRRQWWLVLLCVVLLGGLAAGLTARATPQYRSEVTFFVSTPSGDSASAYTGGLFSQQRVKSYSDLLAGRTTAEAVSVLVPGTSAELVQQRLTAVVEPDTVLLRATVTDSSPTRALGIARALATVFPRQVAQLENPDAQGSSPVQVSVAEQPRLPRVASSPRPLRNLALGLTSGLLLGLALAALRQALDNTVKSREDVREATGAATLGAIGFDAGTKRRPLIVQDEARSVRAEAFRALRTNLQFVSVDGPLGSFVITSAVPSEGKSTMACNLAIALAQAGVRVCLVEGDLRRPKVADYLGLEGAVGLTNVLVGSAALEDVLQPWADGTLEVLASGPIPPNPSEMLGSRGMERVLADLRARFAVVIVDAPPLLPVTDAAVLAALTSGAVLSVRAGHTRKDQLAQAAAALDAAGARLLGVVLNMVPGKGPDSYRTYGYGAYASDSNKPQLTASEARLATEAHPSGLHERQTRGPAAEQVSPGGAVRLP